MWPTGAPAWNSPRRTVALPPPEPAADPGSPPSLSGAAWKEPAPSRRCCVPASALRRSGDSAGCGRDGGGAAPVAAYEAAAPGPLAAPGAETCALVRSPASELAGSSRAAQAAQRQRWRHGYSSVSCAVTGCIASEKECGVLFCGGRIQQIRRTHVRQNNNGRETHSGGLAADDAQHVPLRTERVKPRLQLSLWTRAAGASRALKSVHDQRAGSALVKVPAARFSPDSAHLGHRRDPARREHAAALVLCRCHWGGRRRSQQRLLRGALRCDGRGRRHSCCQIELRQEAALRACAVPLPASVWMRVHTRSGSDGSCRSGPTSASPRECGVVVIQQTDGCPCPGLTAAVDAAVDAALLAQPAVFVTAPDSLGSAVRCAADRRSDCRPQRRSPFA